MTISQQHQQVLQDNWDEARDKIQGVFPRLDEIDMTEYRPGLVGEVAQVTSTEVPEVEQRFRDVARGLMTAEERERDLGQQNPTAAVTTPVTTEGEPTPVQPDAEVREGNGPKR